MNDSLITKLKQFLYSEDKYYLINRKLSSIVCRIKYGSAFGHFERGSTIRKPLYILGKHHIFIGDKVSILYHSRIEAITYYNGQSYLPQIIIGDNTSIGQCFHLCACKEVKIGKNVTFSANIYIADVVHSYKQIGIPVLKQKLLINPTRIGDNSFIGYGASIFPGVTLENSV